MARNLGRSGDPAVPPAVRSATPGWRDPRLWIGIAIVAVSVVAGSRLFAAADDTVLVWAASGEMGSGDEVTEEDLTARRVRFADSADLDLYFRADDQLPADLQLTRGLGAGELLPRGAVASAEASDTMQISIEVEPGKVPVAVAPGSVVDVFLVDPDTKIREGETAEPVLAEVSVVEAPEIAESFGSTSGRRQLVLAASQDAVTEFYGQLAGQADPALYVVQRPRGS